MSSTADGPRTEAFRPLRAIALRGTTDLASSGVSDELRAALAHAPAGDCVCWGIPLAVEEPVLVGSEPAELALTPTRAGWLVFLHTSDLRPDAADSQGFIEASTGRGRLGELAATYVVRYADGAEERLPIRRRHEVGAFQRQWGENCFQAVAHRKPHPIPAGHEQATRSWGRSQTRASVADSGPFVYWLYAWPNPRPDAPITGVRLEPGEGVVVLGALAAGEASSHPLRWEPRRKALLTLPEGDALRPTLDERGLLEQLQLDMGQVISALRRLIYPVDSWEAGHNNLVPEVSEREVLVEYTAHPDASFHLGDGRTVPVRELADAADGAGALHAADLRAADLRAADLRAADLRAVPPATRRVTLRVLDGDGRPVACKLHVHGEAGEYLPPVDRHRIPNPAWFEDYSADFVHQGIHPCTYIDGETRLDLPLGRVYIEVSKGFEIRPLRKVVPVGADTEEIAIQVERVLPWRERGWVSADTHVHFLSPSTALLEGSGEGVNIVNLLASQWGELMTNVGDFDGRTTWGSREAGGDGEYLVRVGTENRQHVLGHISLLGYRGPIIAPMTTGGPDESAIGDPIEILLTEWAQQCHRQGGLVVLPHFPNPRAEHAAAIVHEEIDGIEMTSWGDHYSGISPYSLSDWYRYLNCGYMLAAVGGTDKMSASTAVGTVRTYARIPEGRPFTYDEWMAAVRRADTFVTYGPLLEFAVDGRPMGSRIRINGRGGTVDLTWEVASVTVPVTRVELLVNGEIRESLAVGPDRASGHWSVPVERSSWLALLVRGQYPDRPEMVAAHSSPVMVEVDGSPFHSAADAVTILEQIEGALAYLDTVGTRADDRAYKRMRLVLESAHRRIHNRMHQAGQFHDHTPMEDHPAHH